MDLGYLKINTVKVKQKGVSDCMALEKKLARINFWAVVSQCFSYKMFLPLNDSCDYWGWCFITWGRRSVEEKYHLG